MADLMEAYNHQFAPTAEVLCKRCMVRHRFHAVDELGRPWLFFDVEGELLLEDTDQCREQVVAIEIRRDADCALGMCPLADEQPTTA